jgi:hypothetical protein
MVAGTSRMNITISTSNTSISGVMLSSAIGRPSPTALA